MRPRTLRISVLAIGLAAVAGLYLVAAYSQESERDAFVRRCNEEGAGGMFTSREYCEALYSRSSGKPARKAG